MPSRGLPSVWLAPCGPPTLAGPLLPGETTGSLWPMSRAETLATLTIAPRTPSIRARRGRATRISMGDADLGGERTNVPTKAVGERWQPTPA